jgi:hypothetical protein
MNTMTQNRIDELCDEIECLEHRLEYFCDEMDCVPVTKRFRDEALGHMFVTEEIVCEKGEPRYCPHAGEYQEIEEELERLEKEREALESKNVA